MCVCVYCLPQRRERLVVVDVCGRDGGNHDSLGVAAECRLQQLRQHVRAVGHEDLLLWVVGFVGKGRDAVAQSLKYIYAYICLCVYVYIYIMCICIYIYRRPSFSGCWPCRRGPRCSCKVPEINGYANMYVCMYVYI